MTYLFCTVAFIAGLVIAWIVCRRFPNTQTLDAESIKQHSIIDTERKIALRDNEALRVQIEKVQADLQLAGNRAAENAARAEAEINNSAQLGDKNELLQYNLDEANTTIKQLENKLSFVKAELQYKNEQLTQQKSEVEQIGKKFEAEFKVLAQNILNEKTEAFAKQQEKSLIDILSPLKENIATFKTEIENRYNKESDERISLREQIKHITETNKLLSEQANNLTNALQGQIKQQGNWGEMILESILEHAGLQKDLHYFVQERLYGENGQAFLPDVIVKYPDGRNIVIDSKVSLNKYVEYCSCTEVAAQQDCAKLLVRALYSHIDNLSSKEYQQKANALDFVMMFIPSEGAYITAMQTDMQMWRYAYDKKVLLISPTNLIAAMKLVYDLWKKEAINANATAIAEKAVKIYEKLAYFIEDFEKIGLQLNKATITFNEAEKKLYKGKGNVLSQAHQMKSKLNHNKPTRKLPADLLEQALIEEQAPEEIESDEKDVE